MVRTLFIVVCLGFWAPAWAEDAPPLDPALFDEGVEAYMAGDYVTAYVKWLPFAKAGDPAAQRNIGHMHRKGLGVSQSFERAYQLFKMSAYRGLPTAMGNLALAYYKGEGTDKNHTEARHWFEQAARLHHALSQYHYAYMLHRGLGGSKDIREAFEWYAVAAFSGIDPAGQMMVLLIDDLPPPAVLRAYQRKGPEPSHRRTHRPSKQMLEAQRPGALR